jgi:hypothetical protein
LTLRTTSSSCIRRIHLRTSDASYLRLGFVPPIDHCCSFYLVWRGLVHALVRLHTPLASFDSLCISEQVRHGRLVIGCDTRGSSVMLVLPSIGILLTFIQPQFLAGVWGYGMAWCIWEVRNWDEKHLYSIAFFCFRRSAVINSSLNRNAVFDSSLTHDTNMTFDLPLIIAHVPISESLRPRDCRCLQVLCQAVSAAK